MVYYPLTNRDEAEAAFNYFASRMTEGIVPRLQRVGYSGENREWSVFWRSKEGIWCNFRPNPDDNRFGCAFGTSEPCGGQVSITCEINPPHSGVDLRMGGMFLRDEEGEVHIAHTGRIGGGRPGIGPEGFWTHYADGNVAEVDLPQGRSVRVVLIGRIGDEHLPARVACFVHEVQRIKRILTGGLDA